MPIVAINNDAGVLMDARYHVLLLNQYPINKNAAAIIANCNFYSDIKADECDNKIIDR